MNFLFEGPCHPKNTIGLNLMVNEGMNVDFSHSPNKEYDWIVNFSEFKTYSGHNGGVIYGPQIMFPTIPASSVPNVYGKTYCNLLSDWLVDLNSDINPDIKSIALPFAVEVNRFIPSEKSGKPVIYFKHVKGDRLQSVINKLGNDFIVIRYGSYSEDYYLKSISEAPYVIWIGCHESQGFAFQEALSCNTPIFVINVRSLRDETGSGGHLPWGNFMPGHELKATSASYFDERCGIISYFETWENEIDNFLSNIHSYSPREFIMETLSPRACLDTWINKLRNL
jgi:hypothetical protein